MARRKQAKAQCTYCHAVFAKAGMTKHLANCAQRQQAIATATPGSRAQEALYHLRVQDAWGGTFWLDLEMRGSATLKQLDDYLRAIWLECCGHLSRFAFGGWEAADIAMSRRAEQVFRPGETLSHVYDFGTSSETKITVLGVRTGNPTTKHPIALLARNLPPDIQCTECEQQAAVLCQECIHDDDRPGTLCAQHARKHPHTNYGDPLPLVNSPRAGMCGYEGPAEPPY